MSRSNWQQEGFASRRNITALLSRFSRVFFVEVRNPAGPIASRKAEIPQVTLISKNYDFGRPALVKLGDYLDSLDLRHVTYWVFDPRYVSLVENRLSASIIFHFSEDYFDPSFSTLWQRPAEKKAISQLISISSKVVSVSPGTTQSLLRFGLHRERIVEFFNGVDYFYWAEELDQESVPETPEKTVAYQGGLAKKVDWELVVGVARRMPEFTFNFCGYDFESDPLTRVALEEPNIFFLGDLPREGARAVVRSSSVCWIPFKGDKYLKSGSLPLKAFEYLAAGKPVVSSHIDSLEGHSGLFSFAATVDDFVQAIEEAEESSSNSAAITRRREAAKRQDYAPRFDEVSSNIFGAYSSTYASVGNRENIGARTLVLYCDASTHIGAVRDDLLGIKESTEAEVYFASVIRGASVWVNPNAFNSLVLHWSVKLNSPGHLSSSWFKEVVNFHGLKIVMLQDEWGRMSDNLEALDLISPNLVFSCLPSDIANEVYPRWRYPYTRIVSILPGFIKDIPEVADLPTYNSRGFDVSYRGRTLPIWYGTRGQDKREIAERFAREASGFGIKFDVSSKNEDRLFGDEWKRFLKNSRFMLASESGVSAFDESGKLQTAASLVHRLYGPSAEQIFSKSVLDGFGEKGFSTIGPKFLEAITFRTGLVLIEGEYGGYLEPGRHYFSLKPDFSNLSDFVEFLRSPLDAEKMIEVTYQDFVVSGNYTFAQVSAEIGRTLGSGHLPRVAPLTRARLTLPVLDARGFATEFPASSVSEGSVTVIRNNRGLLFGNHNWARGRELARRFGLRARAVGRKITLLLRHARDVARYSVQSIIYFLSSKK